MKLYLAKLPGVIREEEDMTLYTAERLAVDHERTLGFTWPSARRFTVRRKKRVFTWLSARSLTVRRKT